MALTFSLCIHCLTHCPHQMEQISKFYRPRAYPFSCQSRKLDPDWVMVIISLAFSFHFLCLVQSLCSDWTKYNLAVVFQGTIALDYTLCHAKWENCTLIESMWELAILLSSTPTSFFSQVYEEAEIQCSGWLVLWPLLFHFISWYYSPTQHPEPSPFNCIDVWRISLVFQMPNYWEYDSST